MPVHHVTDLNDPALAVFRNLKDRDAAKMDGLFIAEGEFTARRLIKSDVQTHAVLVCENRAEAIIGITPPNVPIFVAPNRVFDEIIGFKFHRGVIAAGIRPRTVSLESIMAAKPDDAPVTLLVCPEIENHENVGSLVRVAAAFGIDAIIMGESSCDPYWRRSVRVSMGTIFNMPIVRSEDLKRDLLELQSRWNVQLFATVVDDDAEILAASKRPDSPDRMALLLGPESTGLTPKWVDLCDRKVTIPMQLGTDSLNVAIAAGVFFYHYTRGDA